MTEVAFENCGVGIQASGPYAVDINRALFKNNSEADIRADKGAEVTAEHVKFQRD